MGAGVAAAVAIGEFQTVLTDLPEVDVTNTDAVVSQVKEKIGPNLIARIVSDVVGVPITVDILNSINNQEVMKHIPDLMRAIQLEPGGLDGAFEQVFLEPTAADTDNLKALRVLCDEEPAAVAESLVIIARYCFDQPARAVIALEKLQNLCKKNKVETDGMLSAALRSLELNEGDLYWSSDSPDAFLKGKNIARAVVANHPFLAAVYLANTYDQPFKKILESCRACAASVLGNKGGTTPSAH